MKIYVNTVTDTYRLYDINEYVSYGDLRDKVGTFLHMGTAVEGYRQIEGDAFSSELSIIPINAIESIDIY